MKGFLISITPHLLQEIQKWARWAKKEPKTVVQELLEFGLYSKVLYPHEAIELARKLQKSLIKAHGRDSVPRNYNRPVALLFEGRLRTPAELLYSMKNDTSEGDDI